MNNENANVNMNIPSNPPIQPAQSPQPTQPQQPERPKPAPTVPVTKMHTQPHNKMIFLITVTIVFGVLSIVSLVFALRMKDKSTITPVQEETTEVVTETPEEMVPLESGKFDPKAKIIELNKLNLEMVEEAYLDSTLEE